jgi:hypothetical protein
MCTAEFDEHSPIEGLGRVWLRRLQCPTPVVAQRLRARLGALSEPSIALRTARFWARGCELPAVRRADRLVAALRDGGADEA